MHKEVEWRSGLPGLLYIVIVIFLAYITQSSIGIVFLAMLPTLAHVIGMHVAIKRITSEPMLAWAMPPLFTAIIFSLATIADATFLQELQVATVITFNIFASYLLNLLLLPLRPMKGRDKEAENLRKELEAAKKQLAIKPENVQTFLRGIEDKCKALNFVIGRVYSDKRGGSKEIRSKLKIPREWYNLFSELTGDNEIKHKRKLLDLLEKLKTHLDMFRSPEEELFSVQDAKIPLKRELHDSVLQILVRNDKDPVDEYYNNTRQVVGEMIDFLK